MTPKTSITKEAVSKLVDSLEDHDRYWKDFSHTDERWHEVEITKDGGWRPILKCDIEQKLLDGPGIIDPSKKFPMLDTLLTLTKLWIPFGLKTPLQEIVNQIEWEENCSPDCGRCNPDAFPRPKSQAHTELFGFLLELFPNQLKV